jgi:hypothetical protein
VDDVGLHSAQRRHQSIDRRDVAQMRIALDGAAMHPEGQGAFDARQGRCDIVAAKLAVIEEPDVVTASDLFGGKVDDMSEQTAERSAKDMNDAQFTAVDGPRGVHRQGSFMAESRS